jgi:ATP-dependent Clp protease adaptor protein ClpS
LADESEKLPGSQESVLTNTGTEPAEPKMFKVVLLNDHYTTMEFVVTVLVKVFQKPSAEATAIMLDVHKKGAGTCGVYTFDVAMSKIDQVHKLAQENDFPLRCTSEPA